MNNDTKQLSPAEELALMIKLAAVHHYQQFDKGGRPYVLHVLKVMHYTKSDDDQVNAIAVGHDLIEDTLITKADLQAMGFSERVIAGVECLTKQAGQSTEKYLHGILNNRDAIVVKLSDLRHNTDIRRLKGIRQKDFTRLEKYHKMHVTLKQAKEWYEQPANDRSPWHRSEMVSSLIEKFMKMGEENEHQG